MFVRRLTPVLLVVLTICLSAISSVHANTGLVLWNKLGSAKTDFSDRFAAAAEVEYRYGDRWVEYDIYASEDAQVVEGYPTTNYGLRTDPEGRIGIRSKATSRYDIRSFLKFDLSGIPDPASADPYYTRLYLYRYSYGGLIDGITDVDVHKVADDSWSEGTITWANQPAMGDLVSSWKGGAGFNWWDIASYVKEEWDGDKTISMALKAKVEGYDSVDRYQYFYSKDYYPAAWPVDRPKIAVRYDKLTSTIISAPASAELGKTFTVTWKVMNNMPIPANDVWVYSYVFVGLTCYNVGGWLANRELINLAPWVTRELTQTITLRTDLPPSTETSLRVVAKFEGNDYDDTMAFEVKPMIPVTEFALTLPVVTSIALAAYLTIKRRISRRE